MAGPRHSVRRIEGGHSWFICCSIRRVLYHYDGCVYELMVINKSVSGDCRLSAVGSLPSFATYNTPFCSFHLVCRASSLEGHPFLLECSRRRFIPLQLLVINPPKACHNTGPLKTLKVSTNFYPQSWSSSRGRPRALYWLLRGDMNP